MCVVCHKQCTKNAMKNKNKDRREVTSVAPLPKLNTPTLGVTLLLLVVAPPNLYGWTDGCSCHFKKFEKRQQTILSYLSLIDDVEYT